MANKTGQKTGGRLDSEKIIFYAIFVFLAGLFVFVCLVTGQNLKREVSSYTATSVDYADQRISSLYYEINNMPSGAGNDLLFLSKMVGLTERADGAHDEAADYLLSSLKEFMNQNPVYLSIKVIKSDGSEGFNLGRVNDNGDFATATASGPVASEKSFFAKVASLKKDEVYISDFEAWSYQRTPVWTMRYATPLIDEFGKCSGVLVLTVNVGYFLEDIRNFSRPGEQVFLVDEEGAYLANQDVNKESLTSGSRYNFNLDFPEFAQTVLTGSDKRMIETSSHLVTFRYIRPTLSSFVIYKGSEESADNSDDVNRFYWVLVSVSDRDDSERIISNLKIQHRFLIGITAGLIALVAIAAAALRLMFKKHKN
ncbi:MAG: cache domain-containing protein [Patescibacteria group bacterium]